MSAPDAAPPAPESSPPPARPKSWRRRNVKWLLPLGCVGAMVLSITVIGGGAYLWVFQGAGNDVYHLALQKVQQSPAVIAALGEPIAPTENSLPVGSAEGLEAEGSFDISGPKGKATVECLAFFEDGKWQWNILLVQPENAIEPIDLADLD